MKPYPNLKDLANTNTNRQNDDSNASQINSDSPEQTREIKNRQIENGQIMDTSILEKSRLKKPTEED